MSLNLMSKASVLDICDGKNYIITTWTFRVSPELVNEYHRTLGYDQRDSFLTDEDYKNYQEDVASRRASFKMTICELLGVPTEGTEIVQILSEMFAACRIERA